jgi:peptidyl-prolyl cis-trans isomerase SurA
MFYRHPINRSRMKRLPLMVGLMFIALASTPIVWGEEIDRLLAAVNGEVITEGDLELARSMNEALLSGKKSNSESIDQSLSKLINIELLRQELKNFGMAKEDDAEVESRLKSLRETHAKTGSLQVFLRQFGLLESELINYLRFESSMLRFIDFRFRPFVNVAQEEIKSYYDKILTPQIEEKKGKLPPLPEVSSQIEEILRQEKITEAYSQWIGNIRRNSRIEYFDNEKSQLPNSKSR